MNAGSIVLGSTGGDAVSGGNLIIGDGVGGTGADVAILTQSNQISDNSVVTINASGRLDLDGFDETIASLNSTSSNAQVLLGGGTLTTGDGTNHSFAGTISESGDLIKEGSGELTLTGNNTFTGEVNVNDGTLKLDNASGEAISGASDINITDGTLLLGRSDQIRDTSNLSLSNGLFDTGGFDEDLGTLTLSSTSTIDMGNGDSIVAFADSSGETWSGTIYVTNWDGNKNSGGGTDQLFFGTNFGGLTSAQVNQFRFVDPKGKPTGIYRARLLASGEIVPVPEASTIWAALFLFGLVGFDFYRRSRGIVCT